MRLSQAFGWSLLLVVACGYVLKPHELFTVGRAAPGERFWQPSKAITIGDIGLIRVSRSHDQCNEDCKNAAVLFNHDGNFNVFNYDLFCGGGGVVNNESIVCFGKQVTSNESGIHVKRVEYTVNQGELTQKSLEEDSFFSVPGFEHESLRVASNVAHFPERQVYVCTGELKLTNGTKVHAFFRSSDGVHWNMTSLVPFDFHPESTIHRLGETKLMVIAGSPGNYTQATSVFLGSRWEKVENVSYAVPLSTWVSPFFTTLYGGVRGRPGVHAMAAGPKKGSEKPIDIAHWHNRLAAKQDQGILNFSTEFKESTRFACDDPFSTEDSDGCSSSSYVAVTSLGNGTVFFFYDKLESGFSEATKERTSAIHAIKAHLNETREETEHAAKLEEKKREAEREQKREEARRQAQKDADERKRRERRDKVKRDKAKRAAFFELDRGSVENAAKYAKQDGEVIIVRDVDPDFVEIEKDTFFF
jgi:hypothetical protein